MFGRGASTRDRQIIASKASAMLARGPAGRWRLAKNAIRFVARIQERPIPVGRWPEIFIAAGLTQLSAFPVVAEAAIVSGVSGGLTSRLRRDLRRRGYCTQGWATELPRVV